MDPSVRDGLLKLGIVKVIVAYAGSSDSGAVESFKYLNKEGQEVTGFIPPIQGDGDINVFQALEYAIENMTVRHISGDWYNNEGGQGRITWNLKPNTLDLHEEYNEMTVVTEKRHVKL